VRQIDDKSVNSVVTNQDSGGCPNSLNIIPYPTLYKRLNHIKERENRPHCTLDGYTRKRNAIFI
jgi:hypothetical protein